MKILEKKLGIMLIEKKKKKYIRFDGGEIAEAILQVEITNEETERILNKEITMESVVNYYDNQGLCSKDTLRYSLIRDYLLTFDKYNEDRIMETIEKLKKYGDIFFEFYDFVLYENFPTEDRIEVEGYTAEKLYNTTMLNPLGAYNYLIYLRDNPEEALAYLKAGLPVKDVIVFNDESNEETLTDRGKLISTMELPNNIRTLSEKERNEIICETIIKVSKVLKKIKCDSSEYKLSQRQQATKNNAINKIKAKDFLEAYYEIEDFVDDYGDRHNGKVFEIEKQEINNLISIIYNNIKQ